MRHLKGRHWHLDKSTLCCNGQPVMLLSGIANLEVDLRGRKELRQRIVRALNAEEQGAPEGSLICDLDAISIDLLYGWGAD